MARNPSILAYWKRIFQTLLNKSYPTESYKMQKQKKNRSSGVDSRKGPRKSPRATPRSDSRATPRANPPAKPRSAASEKPRSNSRAVTSEKPEKPRFGRGPAEDRSKRGAPSHHRGSSSGPRSSTQTWRSHSPEKRERPENRERPESRERPEYTGPKKAPGQASQQSLAASIIYGKRPVELMLEKCRSLENPAQTLESLHIMGSPDRLPDALAPFVEKATSLGLKVKYTPDAAEFLVPSECNHQRIALSIREFPSMEWEDLDEKLGSYSQQEMASRRGCVGVICDQIQDPHNFGAIMRSAAFFGAEFVVFAKDRQAPVSAAVVRTSAGAAAVLDLVKVTNISRVLAELKNRGLWIVATDCGSEAGSLGDVPNDRPYVLVLGNEEKGVRAEILRAADYRVRIPGGQGTLDSLNAAVAAGVALFALNTAPGATAQPKAP